MYLLYPVEYPARSLAASAVEAALRDGGLVRSDEPKLGARVDGAAVRHLIEDRLVRAKATPLHDRSGAWEVPDSALTLLEQLEAFYHRLYPETAKGGSSQHFYYEQLEWLGQY